jgi:hypothetical protein
MFLEVGRRLARLSVDGDQRMSVAFASTAKVAKNIKEKRCMVLYFKDY